MKALGFCFDMPNWCSEFHLVASETEEKRKFSRKFYLCQWASLMFIAFFLPSVNLWHFCIAVIKKSHGPLMHCLLYIILNMSHLRTGKTSAFSGVCVKALCD